MAIAYMLLSSAAQVVVAFIGRAAGRRAIDPALLLAGAVLIAGLVTLIAAITLEPLDAVSGSLHAHQLAMPLVTAALGCVGMVCYFEALKVGPTGPIATIIGLQVLVPVLLAAALWHDRLAGVQIIGAVLAGVSMCLVHSRDGQVPSPPETRAASGQLAMPVGSWKTLAILSALLQGLANSVFKYKEIHFPQMPTTLFLAAHFGLCFVFLGGYLLYRRQRPSSAAMPFAFLMSLAMIASNGGMILALKGLPATVVYLTVLAGSVVLVVLISMVAMGERYPRRVQAAIAAGVVGIALLVGGGNRIGAASGHEPTTNKTIDRPALRGRLTNSPDQRRLDPPELALQSKLVG